MENHNVQWINPLFLWPFSIAMSVYQTVPSSEDTKNIKESGRRGSSIEKRHHMNPSQRHQLLPVN